MKNETEMKNWKDQFNYDFRTVRFDGQSLDEQTDQAIEYFTNFIEKVLDDQRDELYRLVTTEIKHDFGKEFLKMLRGEI